jgi:hypothetical protein
MADQGVFEVLSLTQDMMVCVIDGRWDELIEMQLEQDQMIKNLFSDAGRLFLKEEKENLFEVQRLNQEILNAAELHKTEIASKLSDMRQGKSKAGAYQSL